MMSPSTVTLLLKSGKHRNVLPDVNMAYFSANMLTVSFPFKIPCV